MKNKVITEEVLEKSQKAQRIFDEAENFFLASNILANSIDKSDELKKLGMRNVFNINHAFAIELYLKCLQIIEKGNYQGGHVLIKLFNRLDYSTKDTIRHLYNQKWLEMRYSTIFFIKPNEGDFVELLKEIKEPFVAFRYLSENEDGLPLYKLENAINCLRSVIFELDEIIDQKHNVLF